MKALSCLKILNYYPWKVNFKFTSEHVCKSNHVNTQNKKHRIPRSDAQSGSDNFLILQTKLQFGTTPKAKNLAMRQIIWSPKAQCRAAQRSDTERRVFLVYRVVNTRSCIYWHLCSRNDNIFRFCKAMYSLHIYSKPLHLFTLRVLAQSSCELCSLSIPWWRSSRQCWRYRISFM